MRYNLEHFEAEQEYVNKTRKKLIEQLPKEDQEKHNYVDNIIAEATERGINLFVFATLPMPSKDGKVHNNSIIQYNNDMFFIEHNISGHLTKESCNRQYEIFNKRLYMFIKCFDITNKLSLDKLFYKFTVRVGQIYNILRANIEGKTDDEQ